MDNHDLSYRVRELHPLLQESTYAFLSNISNDLNQIAKIGSKYKLDRADFFIIDQNTKLISKPSPFVIVRCAGFSRYNPMRWEDALNLRDGLKNLTNYYEKYQNIIQVGLLLTDVWRPVELYEFFGQLEKFSLQGIQTLPILCSGNMGFPLKLPWN
jgi:hypothetical protein